MDDKYYTIADLINAMNEFIKHVHCPHGVYGNHASGFIDLVSREKKMCFINSLKHLDEVMNQFKMELNRIESKQ